MSCSLSAQPRGRGYFLPGKLAGKDVTFLLDPGCTTNLLSWHLFDTFTTGDRADLKPHEGKHGTLASMCI